MKFLFFLKYIGCIVSQLLYLPADRLTELNDLL